MFPLQRPFLSITFRDDGAWRSPVARLLWEQEVLSSNLGAPIILINTISRLTGRLFSALASPGNTRGNNSRWLDGQEIEYETGNLHAPRRWFTLRRGTGVPPRSGHVI